MKRLFCLWYLIFLHVQLHANSPLIHVFGDSHSLEFSNIQNVVIHYLGPITMNRVGRDQLSFLHLPSHGVQEKEIAIFAFGEIDVRCHVGKQRDLHNRSVSEIIESLANNFMETILANQKLYQNLQCIVYSITPPTDVHFNPDYPIYGSIEARVTYTKQLNRKLKKLCAANHIYFLDVYEDYANKDGTLNHALSDGYVHINAACNHLIAEKLHAGVSTNQKQE